MTATPDPLHAALAQDLVAGDYPFTRADFRRIARMLHDDVGITLSETKAPLVYSRLVKRLRTLGLRSFRDYCIIIGQASGHEERRAMAAALTTNVTRFFREPHHYDHFRTRQLPALVDRARRGGRVRLWSAGCSSGEEAYSLALTVLAACPEAARLDVRILATDIDETMLQRARDGLYSDHAVSPIDRAHRRRWFGRDRDRQGERQWSVGPELRALVAFKTLNLNGAWPMRGPFQTIFCRNVAIYFEEHVRAELWRRLAPMLAADGLLYLGHSERIATGDFEAAGMTVYRRTSADAA
ncbi:MAG TPA: protein-glutamate O-methyltransferase [Caulobacteraceae bacterium]|nr:protein-glutamate O-methyltransferase [Caulobacteraceae bacterium]